MVVDRSPTDQDYNLWVLLSLTRRAMFRARQKELSRYNTSARQAAVLFAVQAIGDAATPAKISRWLFREPHSVSELLSRMEKDGLIRKVKDLDRKNMVRVTLTEKGLKAYQQSIRWESIRRVTAVLSAEERRQLKSILLKLRTAALREMGREREYEFPETPDAIETEVTPIK